MTELDFEELDKAVSDLMKDTDSEPTSDGNGTVVQTPAVSPVSQDDAMQPQQSSVPAQPAAASVVRNRGRFMDVKPSNNPVTTGKPVEQVSHQAPTVDEPQGGQAPIDSVATVLEPQPAVTLTGAVDYAANPAVASDAQVSNDAAAPVEEAHSFTMPDPIDVASAAQPVGDESPEVPQEPADQMASEVVAPAADEPKIDTEVQPEAAMESPFIPDAKVEKRPLGGFPNAPSDENVAPTDDTPEDAEPAPLPRELGSDLMNLETDGNDVGGAKKDEPKIESSTEPMEHAAPSEQPTDNVVPATAPVADTKTSGAIFDTANYHNMPVAAPVKKKHGWLVVIWILVLLIVGACAGAAYFYFTTQ